MIPTRAFRLDAPTIAALRDELAHWQAAEGSPQWQPGELDPDAIREQIVDGQWWVLRDDGALNATMRVVGDDPAIWDDLVSHADKSALYVHGLMVRRLHAGRGLGERMLEHAAGLAAEHGRTVLRLDCPADNVRLCAYYAAQGFAERGTRTFDNGWGTLMRFEKPVG